MMLLLSGDVEENPGPVTSREVRKQPGPPADDGGQEAVGWLGMYVTAWSTLDILTTAESGGWAALAPLYCEHPPPLPHRPSRPCRTPRLCTMRKSLPRTCAAWRPPPRRGRAAADQSSSLRATCQASSPRAQQRLPRSGGTWPRPRTCQKVSRGGGADERS